MSTTRSWTVLHYLVASPFSSNTGTIPDAFAGVDLTAAANAELAGIKTAAAVPVNTTQNMYVAYHVANKTSPANAKRGVIHQSLEEAAPAPPTTPANLRMFADFLGFLDWAMPRCPASHYAVFLWGHSLGPAGLFDIADAGTSVELFSPPGPIGSIANKLLYYERHFGRWLEELVRRFMKPRPPRPRGPRPGPPPRMRGGSGGPGAMPGGIGSGPRRPGGVGNPTRPGDEVSLSLGNLGAALRVFFADPGEGPVVPVGFPGNYSGVGQRCDVMVFKNCYMSVLEAALELQEVAQYVIASQSQVPINKYLPGTTNQEVPGVWPHDRCLTCFDDVGGAPVPPDVAAAKVHKEIADFYSVAENRASFTEVPYSLLDITKAVDVRDAFHNLAIQLQGLKTAPDPQGIIARGTIIDQAVTGPLKPQPGNVALVDLKRLCASVQNTPAAAAVASAEATALDLAIDKLVVKQEPPGSVCRGVSHFYFPTATSKGIGMGANDFKLHGEIIPGNYGNLELGKLHVGYHPDNSVKTWSHAAFEQQ